MLIVRIILIVLLGSIAGYIQWMYANANYPTSRRWKVILFISGGLACAFVVSLLPFSNLAFLKKLLLIGSGGLFGGYLFLVTLPEKMQMIVPKKE